MDVAFTSLAWRCGATNWWKIDRWSHLEHCITLARSLLGCLHYFPRYHGSGCGGCVIVEYCITLARSLLGCLHCFLRYHGSGCAGCVIVEYCITLARSLLGCLHCFLRYHGSGCAGCVIVEYCITLARYVLDVYTVSPDITDLVVEAASLWNIVLH